MVTKLNKISEYSSLGNGKKASLFRNNHVLWLHRFKTNFKPSSTKHTLLYITIVWITQNIVNPLINHTKVSTKFNPDLLQHVLVGLVKKSKQILCVILDSLQIQKLNTDDSFIETNTNINLTSGFGFVYNKELNTFWGFQSSI